MAIWGAKYTKIVLRKIANFAGITHFLTFLKCQVRGPNPSLTAHYRQRHIESQEKSAKSLEIEKKHIKIYIMA